jgi:hypothetical protein
MPTPTYTPLANVTLGSAAASVTFSSIPATYRDLVFVMNGTVASNPDLLLSFNGDTSNIYTNVLMEGAGGVAGSFSITRTGIFVMSGSTVRIMMSAQIMDYSATDKHKTVLSRGDNPTVQVLGGAGRWPSTAAITSLAVRAGASTFDSGSTFALYGIAS